MSVIDNINNGAAGLAEFKEELGAAIEEKGVTVDPEQPLATYVGRVRAIPAADGDYVTNAELEAKDYVTNTELEAKDYVTNTELEGKGYITDTELEGKDYVTDTELEGKDYVTSTELEGKGYITDTELEGKDYVTNAELEAKDYITNADLENLPMGGGNHIGSIFAHPSANPPPGAFLLDGQTIYNCYETYREFWVWIDTESAAGNIRILTAVEYENAVAQYGICGAFVISENDVRLPLWNGYQTPLGDSVPVKGNGMALGLTDGTNNMALSMFAPGNDNNGMWGVGNAYGVNVGTSAYQAIPATNLAIGVTTDPTKSGIIADTSGYPKDGFYWCIQVFNAATKLSQQESAQLASQMQMKAQTNLANVTNPTQAFKTMAIGWGMPDYSAGVDITSNFATAGAEYTVPYDCCIAGYSFSILGAVFIFSEAGCSYVNGLSDTSKAVLYVDGDSEGNDFVEGKAYCQKGMKLYQDANIGCVGKVYIYPLKGADK